MPKPPTRDDRAIVRGPATSRTFTQWTPDDVEIAEALTNGGNLQRAADLCWALLADGRVRAALETRVRGLLRLPLSWEESGDGRSAGRVIRALEKGGDFYAAHSEAALYSLGLWGILLGIGVNQRVWRVREGRWIGVHKPYDARNLRWDPRARKWVLRTEGSDLTLLPGDRRWVLLAPSCSGDPDGDERPWMYGAWRACARPTVLKYLSLSDWGHHMQLHGSGIRTAEFDPDNPPDKPAREALCNMLADLSSDTALVPPPGATLKLLEAVANTWKQFPEAMRAMATEIVVSITGQSSSTEVVQGQDTGATLHGRVRQDLIDCDAETFTTCLHDRDLVDYAELNFGDRELAPYPRYKTAPPTDIGAQGDAMKKFGDGMAALAAQVPEGKELDREAMFESAGFALKAAKKPTPAPVPAPQPLEETPAP